MLEYLEKGEATVEDIGLEPSIVYENLIYYRQFDFNDTIAINVSNQAENCTYSISEEGKRQGKCGIANISVEEGRKYINMIKTFKKSIKDKNYVVSKTM